MQTNDFNKQLEAKKQMVDSLLGECLEMQGVISGEMRPAIEYALKSPGKRIRGAIVLWCCEVISGKVNRDGQMAAAAIEMVHTYSLVHDDLPAMDDDDLRRGQATCHKAFDEATAILAGDGLLTLGFEVLGKEVDDAETAVKLIWRLAQSAGAGGMIAGQMADIQSEGCGGDLERLEYIHTNKTAKMFSAAAAMGAIAGGGNERQIKALSEYGLKIGLAFQVADDILDVSATSEQLGKTAGKDAKAGKMTYPALVGLERSKEIAKQLSGEALKAIDRFGGEADMLRKLVGAMLERTK